MRALFPALAFAAVLLLAAPAGAHTGFSPDEVGPGLEISLTLDAADERDAAAIAEVELVLPEDADVPVVELPAVGGWTAERTERGVVWRAEAPVDGDVQLPLVVGPVPDSPRRLQFRVLQTYDDGDVDRWIEDFPADGAAPSMPGPVLDVVEGGPGSPPRPVTTTIAPSTTAASPTTPGDEPPATGEEEPDGAATGAADDGDDATDLGPVFAAVAAVAALAALGLFFTRRARR